MAIQIQLRRDLAAAWVAANPVLAQGEIGIETDTSQSKLGNGIDPWNVLPYWPSGGGGGAIVLDTADRIALVPTSDGVLVYDTDLGRLYVWQDPFWIEV